MLFINNNQYINLRQTCFVTLCLNSLSYKHVFDRACLRFLVNRMSSLKQLDLNSNSSQIDPDVFAALPKELQEELKSAYSRVTKSQKDQAKLRESFN